MFDLIIRNGLLVDGSGAKAVKRDVAVLRGAVAAVGSLGDAQAAREIDADGKVVCPGFIDIHSHNDLYAVRDDAATLFEPYLRQGITTAVVNNCGWSMAPWPDGAEQSALMLSTLRSMGVSAGLQPQWRSQAEFHAFLSDKGLPLNMIPLAAHNPIRIAVMGGEARFSTPEELAAMRRMLGECMEAGCFGFSTGLTYFPGMYAHTDELVELARVCAERGGRYVSHVRGHSETYDRAVEEALEIGSRSGAPVQLSHVFAVPYLGSLANVMLAALGAIEAVNRVVPLPGVPNPVLKKAVARVDRALADGMDVGMDFIPYVLGNSTVTQLYPPWANIGGTDALLGRLRDPAQREKIRYDVEHVRPVWPHWDEGSWSDNYVKAIGWKMLRILSVGSEKNNFMEGERVVDLARDAGRPPFDFLADLAVEEDGMVTFVFGVPPGPWNEKVFTRVQRHPQLSVGADVLFPEFGLPPQSAYGCFVRIMEHYVKELGMYSLEEAVHRCTGLAASRYGLADRGVIEKGAAADILVLDWERLHDNSRFDDPAHFPDGVEQVLVNGTVVVDGEAFDAGALAGTLVLKR